MIPFIGFRWIPIDNKGMPCEAPSHWKGKAFMLEWFGHGLIIYIGEVRAWDK